MAKKKSKLDEALAQAAKTMRFEPLWKGPAKDGITQSMLQDFLNCRERFRVKYVLGLRPPEKWEKTLGYGNMWHLCEEVYACDNGNWSTALDGYQKSTFVLYPEQQEEILHWANVCRAQFPAYIDYWDKHREKGMAKPVYQEKNFEVEHILPSHRTVLLRGKWDSVDMLLKGSRSKPEIWLQENKTRGEIVEDKIANHLNFDLQTGLYIAALYHEWSSGKLGGRYSEPKTKLSGVRYNVVRRPLAGGKHTIRQKKNQTAEEFYAELGERIANDPEFFFMRWSVYFSVDDIEKFLRRFLDPILEQLCDWWEWIAIEWGKAPWREGEGYHIHWQSPFGVYNKLIRTGFTDYDDYLATGSTLGLEKADRLFKELD